MGVEQQKIGFCNMCFGEGGCNHQDTCVWIQNEGNNDPKLAQARFELLELIGSRIRSLLRITDTLPESILLESRETVEVARVDDDDDAPTEPARPDFTLSLIENDGLPDVDTQRLEQLPTFDDLFDDGRIKSIQDFLNALAALSSAKAYFVVDSKVAAVGRSERGIKGATALDHEILAPKQLPVSDLLQPLLDVWDAFEKYIDLFSDPVNGPILMTSVRTMLGLSIPDRIAQYREEFIWEKQRAQKGNVVSLKERFLQLLSRAAEQKDNGNKQHKPVHRTNH